LAACLNFEAVGYENGLVYRHAIHNFQLTRMEMIGFDFARWLLWCLG